MLPIRYFLSCWCNRVASIYIETYKTIGYVLPLWNITKCVAIFLPNISYVLTWICKHVNISTTQIICFTCISLAQKYLLMNIFSSIFCYIYSSDIFQWIFLFNLIFFVIFLSKWPFRRTAIRTIVSFGNYKFYKYSWLPFWYSRCTKKCFTWYNKT